LQLPRMTTRRWMLAVAATAIGITGWRLYHYGEIMRAEHRSTASFYRVWEDGARLHASVPHEKWLADQRAAERQWRESGTDPLREKLEWRQAGLPPGRYDEWLREYRAADRDRKQNGPAPIFGPALWPAAERRRAEYFARMRVKYERAARYPWLPVPPGPPPP